VSVHDFMDSLNAQVVGVSASSESLQRALAPLMAKRSEVAGIERQLGSLDAQLRSIVEDQQRLRENMKALRGSAEEKQLLQRYTRQLDDQENKLDALVSEVAETTKKRDGARQELHALIGNLTFDAN
jgi:chromosome segregation ATPase